MSANTQPHNTHKWTDGNRHIEPETLESYNNRQRETQQSGGDELDKLLSSFHGYVCHSLQSWFKGQTEPFPCDCSVKELKVALQARERKAEQRGRIDELDTLVSYRAIYGESYESLITKRSLEIKQLATPQAGEGGEV